MVGNAGDKKGGGLVELGPSGGKTGALNGRGGPPDPVKLN